MNKESKLNLNAGDYAISHCDSDKTYNGLEVHKMLCDAYIAGNNDTLDDEAYRKAYYDGYNKCNRDWIHSQEDERIKNRLINLIKMSNEAGGFALHKWEADEMLTWLEKQGEQDILEDAILDGNEDGLIAETIRYKNEKQGKQLVGYTTIVETGDGGINALVVRDIEIPFGAKDSELQEFTYFIPQGYYAKIEDDKVVIKKGVQKPAEWSEDDEQHIDSLLKRLDALCRNKFERTRFAISEDRDWLKSLKGRVQHQQEWSKEDEACVILLDSICESSEAEYYDHPDSIIRKEIVNARNWLKYLKGRVKPQWKPSDEQMRILDLAIRGGINHGTREETTLVSLYEDLKKLKEGKV